MTSVAVIGAGYVGLVQAVGLAGLGVPVALSDRDLDRVRAVAAGDPVIHEEGLGKALGEVLAEGLLRVTSSNLEAVVDAGVVFLALPTPAHPDGQADLSAVEGVVAEIIPHLAEGAVLVIKSTVPVGTARRLASVVGGLRADVEVVSNPEFLREGNALGEFLDPDRIVLGGPSGAVAKVMSVYAGMGAPVVETDPTSAELIKYSSNAFLALRLSFVNEVAELSRRVAGDFDAVAHGMSLDPRIGTGFLTPGPGWGGSCFPKDTRALLHSGTGEGMRIRTVEAAVEANTAVQRLLIDRLSLALGGLAGRRIAVWGLAFKAGTNDVRDSPALSLIGLMEAEGAEVIAYDPVATDRTVKMASSALEAAKGSDALVVATEWPELAEVPVGELADVLSGRVVLDARGVLDRNALEAAGLTVLSVGRPD